MTEQAARTDFENPAKEKFGTFDLDILDVFDNTDIE
jgi:hypothetical protein